MFVYVVNENGQVYPSVYSTYELAVSAIQKKYPDEYEESKDPESIHQLARVKENMSGTTEFYIEKEISISIMKLPVKYT